MSKIFDLIILNIIFKLIGYLLNIKDNFINLYKTSGGEFMSNSISGFGSELSAELTLNKIMNGQLQTESGRTVNAASRQQSVNLNQEAEAINAINPTLKAESAELYELQGMASELRLVLTDLYSAANAETPDLATIANLGDAAAALHTAMAGNSFYGATAKELDLGLGAAVDFGGENTDVETLMTAVGTLAGSTSANIAANVTAFNSSYDGDPTAGTPVPSGIDALINLESSLGNQYNILANRTALNDDLVSTYTETASNEYVQGINGSTDLLNNVIG